MSMLPNFSSIPELPMDVAQSAYAAAICQGGHRPTRLLLADMTQPSAAARLWVLDVSNPEQPELVLRSQVAHGYGSDPARSGNATHFSDVEGSGMTSLGLYRVGEPYAGKHGHSYRLTGLSSSNAHALARDITRHPANYVTPRNVGRSAGCAAVGTDFLPSVERRWGSLTGSFLYIAGPGLSPVSCAQLVPWTPPAWAVLQRACIQGSFK